VLLAQVSHLDDFAIGPAGELIFTTHGARLKRRSADGAVSVLMTPGCDGCTAVAIAAGAGVSSDHIALTTAGLAEASKQPARVLRLSCRS
jgi:hypothetical protein